MYNIILADPPWQYADQKSNDPAMGGITYPVMPLDDICNLPVKEITDTNCFLFLWATMPLLPEAIQVIDSWGFRYITCAFAWIKLNPTGSLEVHDKDVVLRKGVYSGLGHWTNGNVELCLLGKRGKPKRVNKNVKQIIIAPRGKHSAKPVEVHERIINLCGDLPRIELFARNIMPGWDSTGNDLDGTSIETFLHDKISGKEV